MDAASFEMAIALSTEERLEQATISVPASVEIVKKVEVAVAVKVADDKAADAVVEQQFEFKEVLVKQVLERPKPKSNAGWTCCNDACGFFVMAKGILYEDCPQCYTPRDRNWECTKCSMRNSVAKNVECQGCRQPNPVAPDWNCRACTVLNKGASIKCQVCDTSKKIVDNNSWVCEKCQGINSILDDATCKKCAPSAAPLSTTKVNSVYIRDAIRDSARSSGKSKYVSPELRALGRAEKYATGDARRARRAKKLAKREEDSKLFSIASKPAASAILALDDPVDDDKVEEDINNANNDEVNSNIDDANNDEVDNESKDEVPAGFRDFYLTDHERSLQLHPRELKSSLKTSTSSSSSPILSSSATSSGKKFRFGSRFESVLAEDANDRELEEIVVEDLETGTAITHKPTSPSSRFYCGRCNTRILAGEFFCPSCLVARNADAAKLVASVKSYSTSSPLGLLFWAEPSSVKTKQVEEVEDDDTTGDEEETKEKEAVQYSEKDELAELDEQIKSAEQFSILEDEKETELSELQEPADVQDEDEFRSECSECSSSLVICQVCAEKQLQEL